MLRKGLAEEAQSAESSPGDTFKPTPEQPAQRFDHYDLVTGEDGKPVELGRGAMGVTYKALDVNLLCPVTASDTLVMNRLGFAFYVKPVQRRAFVTRMLPRSST
jgi:hypothetical protein